MNKSKYMNPYLAGVLLGLVLLAAMFLSGRGLGASGGIKDTVVAVVGAVDKQHAIEYSLLQQILPKWRTPAKKLADTRNFRNGCGWFSFRSPFSPSEIQD